MRIGITQAYIDFVQSCTRAVVGHLYLFTSLAGAVDFFTDLDFDVNYNSFLWKSSSLRIDGLRRKTSIGLTVDEQALKIYALPTDTIFGGNFLTAAEAGVLDGCLIQRYRAVWAVRTGDLLADVQNNPPIMVWQMFVGYTSKIDKGGQTRIEMKVKSPLVKLEVNMPRNFYQPGCNWTLFDNGCTLNKASFATDFTVSVGGKNQITIAGSIAVGADGLAQYAQGRLLFTSGANNGLLILIDANDTNDFYLAYPLNIAPSAGDTFTAYPGCSKSFTTCDLKFGNKANFRGFDKGPPIAVSI